MFRKSMYPQTVMRFSFFVFLIILTCCTKSQKIDDNVSFRFQCSDSFLDYVTSDFGGNSSFIVVEVRVLNEIRKICIPNADLYTDLTLYRGVAREQYKSAVAEILRGKHFDSRFAEMASA